jgi:hypothetical protein
VWRLPYFRAIPVRIRRPDSLTRESRVPVVRRRPPKAARIPVRHLREENVDRPERPSESRVTTVDLPFTRPSTTATARLSGEIVRLIAATPSGTSPASTCSRKSVSTIPGTKDLT